MVIRRFLGPQRMKSSRCLKNVLIIDLPRQFWRIRGVWFACFFIYHFLSFGIEANNKKDSETSFEYFFNMSSNGSYRFLYNTGNGEHKSFREEKRGPKGVVSGTFGYVDPNGILRVTEYVADSKGYRAKLEEYRPVNVVPRDRPLIVGPIPSPLRTDPSKKAKMVPFDMNQMETYRVSISSFRERLPPMKILLNKNGEKYSQTRIDLSSRKSKLNSSLIRNTSKSSNPKLNLRKKNLSINFPSLSHIQGVLPKSKDSATKLPAPLRKKFTLDVNSFPEAKLSKAKNILTFQNTEILNDRNIINSNSTFPRDSTNQIIHEIPSFLEEQTDKFKNVIPENDIRNFNSSQKLKKSNKNQIFLIRSTAPSYSATTIEMENISPLLKNSSNLYKLRKSFEANYQPFENFPVNLKLSKSNESETSHEADNKIKIFIKKTENIASSNSTSLGSEFKVSLIEIDESKTISRRINSKGVSKIVNIRNNVYKSPHRLKIKKRLIIS